MREYIKWDEKLSVDIDMIDNQHKELFRLINAFYNSIAANSGRAAILQAILDMERYTMVHFSGEEAMMKKVNYPYLAQHQKEHQHFIATVAEFKRRYEEGRLLLSLEVTGFVKSWIVNHIKKTDQSYRGKLI